MMYDYVDHRETEARKARRAMLEQNDGRSPTVKVLLPEPHRRKGALLMPYPSEVFPTEYNWRLPEWRRRAGYSAYKQHWCNTREYVSMILGNCVGFYNIIYFPMIASQQGPGAFILSYTVCLFVIGFPLLFLQLALGQFTAKDVLRVFTLVPLAGGLGVTMMLYSTICTVYKNVKVAWIGYYFFNSFKISFSPTFYWNPTWKDCVLDKKLEEHNSQCGHSMITNLNLSNFRCTYDFYHSEVLGLYPHCDVNTFDLKHESWDIHWRLFGVLVFVYCLGYLISFKGIKSIGPCVEVIVPTSCGLMVIFMIINIVTHQTNKDLAKAAIQGIEVFYTPKMEDLLNFEIWFMAALHTLHSLNLDTGTMILIGSHARFQSSAQYHALYICIADLVVSLISGTIIYGEMGILASKIPSDVPGRYSGAVEDYVTSYILYILSAIDRIDRVSGMFVFIYFFILLILGTIHLVMIIFVVVKPLFEFFPVVMKWKTLSTLASFILFLLITIPFLNRGSRSIFITVESWLYSEEFQKSAQDQKVWQNIYLDGIY